MTLKNNGKKLLLAGLAAGAFLYWQDNALTVTQMTCTTMVPKAFHGYKILHISDLQNKMFGKNQERLIYKAECTAPDLIVITGDLIDRNRTDLDAAMDLIRGIVKLAPVYYVSGNHEDWSGEYEKIAEMIASYGVTVLEGETTKLDLNGNVIQIAGVNDPDKFSDFSEWESQLEQVKAERNDDDFTILLSHRPELVQWYAESGFDLVAAGHAHG